MTNAEVIAVVYGVGGTLFLAGFFLAVVTTGARTLWYLRHAGEPMPLIPPTMHDADVVTLPRLLLRDIIVKGGMFISFGLIAALRFLPPERRTAFVTDNVPWALITTVPAVVAILCYCWFELRVIPRNTA